MKKIASLVGLRSRLASFYSSMGGFKPQVYYDVFITIDRYRYCWQRSLALYLVVGLRYTASETEEQTVDPAVIASKSNQMGNKARTRLQGSGG